MNQAEKSERVLKIYPWYSGLSEGLLFYTAVSTLFLTIVKGLNASQIAMLGTISTLACILLQKVLLTIIKKIGNVYSIRIGTLFFLLSALLITFGNYYLIMLGLILEVIAVTFKDMENIILRNNLTYLNKVDEYIKYKNKAFLVYSITTAIIALLASYLFNYNHYLPMICCITFCVITLFMSFYIEDVRRTEYTVHEENIDINSKTFSKKLILSIIVSFGIVRTCIALGFNNSLLFIQYDLQSFFDIYRTTYYLGFIIFVSRIIRIISNISFNKIYYKFKEKLVYLIPISLLISFVLLLFSHYYIYNLILKFFVMGLAYGIILYVIDSFGAVIQDILLKNSNVEHRQQILTYLSFSYNLFKTIFGLVISLILLNHSLSYVLLFLIVLVLVGIFNFRVIYSKIKC